MSLLGKLSLLFKSGGDGKTTSRINFNFSYSRTDKGKSRFAFNFGFESKRKS